MKNVTSMNSITWNCPCGRNLGFTCTTPCGADWHTCPLCGQPDLSCCPGSALGTRYEQYEKEVLDVADEDDIRFNTCFCMECLIMFRTGCKHSLRGCTDDVYNGHLIGKYEYKGNIYHGMPQFDTMDEWLDHANEITILEWVCPNNGLICPHDKDKDPRWYNKCWLKK